MQLIAAIGAAQTVSAILQEVCVERLGAARQMERHQEAIPRKPLF
jgi:hypothetical protein